MSRRVRTLIITAAAPLVAISLLWGVVGSDRPTPPTRHDPEPVASASPSPEPSDSHQVHDSERLYSIPL